MTKTWGFNSPCGPLQFSQAGWRDNARNILQEGDLVVIVATLNDEPDAGDRGRILGIMQPTTKPAYSLDYDLEFSPQDFEPGGSYKWPYALEIRRAWKIDDPRPYFRDVVTRRFGMQAALGIVQLTANEEASVLSLPRTEVTKLTPIRAVAREIGAEAARKKFSPPPPSVRTAVMHFRRAPAYTYAMLLEGADQTAVKIGWAFNWEVRQRHFNLVSLPHLGGPRYRLIFKELWSTAYRAYRMEQSILHQFDDLRHSYNREVLAPVSIQDIEVAWREYMRNGGRRF